MYQVTVLVVAREDDPRARLLLVLQRLGLRALGVPVLADALALVDALDADIILVCSDDAESALAPLQARTQVVKLAADVAIEDAVVALLRALGRPEAAAQIN